MTPLSRLLTHRALERVGGPGGWARRTDRRIHFVDLPDHCARLGFLDDRTKQKRSPAGRQGALIFCGTA